MAHPCRIAGALAFIVASLVVTSPTAAAASPTGKNFTLPAVIKTTYSIAGTVRNNSTSAGVPGVSVSAVCPACTTPFASGSTTTNASGAYTISHLLPGSYALRFDPPRATNLQHGYRGSAAPKYFSATTPVAVTITTAPLTGKDIRLPGGFKISGKVTRSNGTTVIPNVTVSAGGTHGSDGTQTDSAGGYTLMGLSPGSYIVTFGHDPTESNQTGCWYSGAASKFSASCAHETAVVISTTNKTGINPRIPNALKLTGFVKTQAATPAPIVGAWVGATGSQYNSAQTDTAGKYTIVGLNPGSYTIEVDGPYGSSTPTGYYHASGPNFWSRMTASASSVTISAAVTTLSTIKPPTGYFIRGTITNTSGSPVGDVEVRAIGGSGTAVVRPSADTDFASGTYVIGPLPPGNTYKIYADPEWSTDISLQTGWYFKSLPNNFTTARSSALTLAMTGDKNGINMRLPKGASISGVVKIAGAGVCAECLVEALDSEGSEVADTWTSATGTYTLQGLSAGSYRVHAFPGEPVIDATHVRIIASGYYKSGAAPNFSATLAGATAIAASP